MPMDPEPLNRSRPYSDRCSMPALVCGIRLPGFPEFLKRLMIIPFGWVLAKRFPTDDHSCRSRTESSRSGWPAADLRQHFPNADPVDQG